MAPDPTQSTETSGCRRTVHDIFDSVEHKERKSLTDMQSYLRSGSRDAVHRDSWFANFILSQRFEAFGGCIVLINIVIITLETHARAGGDQDMLGHIAIANRVLLAYYIFECSSRLGVLRYSFFCGAWNILDLVIVLTGLLSEVMEVIALSSGGVEQIGMLKSLRMMRLVRLVRLLVAFRELYVLLAGLGRCMKTLLWASGLIFLVLNVWAIVSVEWLHPVVQQLTAEGAFGNCGWCTEAFADVWKANLTWFQVVSGDGWAALGRPLAERAPWTYMFFVTNICVMVWGLLNLVVAAIVDSSIQAREDDVQGAARSAMRARNQAFESFRNICREMDQDGDGEVTTEEFKQFKETNLQLQQHLEVMGITDGDFEKVLKLMDTDGNGTLDFDEFAQEFTRMRSLVVKTNLYYVLRHVEFLHQSMIDVHTTHRQIISDIACLREEMIEMRKIIPASVDDCIPTSPASQGSMLPRLVVSGLSEGSLQSNLAADRLLVASSQVGQEQLISNWSTLQNTAAATLDHCQELCKTADNGSVGVGQASTLEKAVRRRSGASAGSASTSEESMLVPPQVRAKSPPSPPPTPSPPVLIPSPTSPAPPTLADIL